MKLYRELACPHFCSFWYGCIETNGTGGAAFRILFRDFLEEAGEKAGGIETIKEVEAANASIAAWHELANGFKKTAAKIGSIQYKKMRETYYQNLAKLADRLYQEENKLYHALTMISPLSPFPSYLAFGREWTISGVLIPALKLKW